MAGVSRRRRDVGGEFTTIPNVLSLGEYGPGARQRPLAVARRRAEEDGPAH